MRNRIEACQAGISLTGMQDVYNASKQDVCIPLQTETPQCEHRANVLLVSTSGSRSKSYCRVAETLGCKVRSCSSEADAHRSLTDEVFDVIIMDQRGVAILDWDVLMRIVVAEDPELRMLVITAEDQGIHSHEALQRGAMDCFEEVHSASELLPWLDTYLPTRTRNQLSHQTAMPHSAHIRTDPRQAAENRVAARREVTLGLAYKYWGRRGSPVGSPEIDWFRAERDIERFLLYSPVKASVRGQRLRHTSIATADVRERSLPLHR